MKEGVLVKLITFTFVYSHVCGCASHTWGRDAVWEEGKTAETFVMLWTMFCWETLGSGFHVDVTLTYNT